MEAMAPSQVDNAFRETMATVKAEKAGNSAPRVVLIPVNMIDQIWPQVVGGFQKASRRSGGDLTVGDLWVGCRSGHCYLFIVHEGDDVKAATIWKPETWQSGGKFRCMALFGQGMAEWMPELHEMVKRVARDCGATALVAEGREGWRKIFPHTRKIRTLYEEPI